jgi:hypothetical protein
VHPRGESKKFNITRGESKEKNYRGKNKMRPYYRGIIYLPLKKFTLKYVGL